MTKGLASVGALFLSGCGTDGPSLSNGLLLRDPLLLLAALFLTLNLYLAAWWIILRLSHARGNRLFLWLSGAFGIGLLLALAPYLVALFGLPSDAIWLASLIAAYGRLAVAAVMTLTMVCLVWTLLAALIDRL